MVVLKVLSEIFNHFIRLLLIFCYINRSKQSFFVIIFVFLQKLLFKVTIYLDVQLMEG